MLPRRCPVGRTPGGLEGSFLLARVIRVYERAVPWCAPVIGALCISVLLSLVATPVMYYILRMAKNLKAAENS